MLASFKSKIWNVSCPTIFLHFRMVCILKFKIILLQNFIHIWCFQPFKYFERRTMQSKLDKEPPTITQILAQYSRNLSLYLPRSTLYILFIFVHSCLFLFTFYWNFLFWPYLVNMGTSIIWCNKKNSSKIRTNKNEQDILRTPWYLQHTYSVHSYHTNLNVIFLFKNKVRLIFFFESQCVDGFWLPYQIKYFPIFFVW